MTPEEAIEVLRRVVAPLLLNPRQFHPGERVDLENALTTLESSRASEAERRNAFAKGVEVGEKVALLRQDLKRAIYRRQQLEYPLFVRVSDDPRVERAATGDEIGDWQDRADKRVKEIEDKIDALLEPATVVMEAVREPAPPPIKHAVVCRRCGSLINYGKEVGLGGKASHLCVWCPACAPGEPWRRGTVVVEGPDAARLRGEGSS